MFNMYSDAYYNRLIKDILQNKEFMRMKEIEHHGTTRYQHSMRVSFYSYRIAKLLHLDYRETARAGLLHDFFLSEDERTMKDKFLSTFTHPRYAVQNSKKYFSLSKKEVNIIESHMFPIYRTIPIYAESWLVSTVDKVIGTYEFFHQFRNKFKYAFNLYLLFILNVKK